MTRTYTKGGIFSKKPKNFLSKGELENILLSLKKFDEWINKSHKGNTISYYRGFLFAPNEQKLSATLDLKRVEKLQKHVYGYYMKDLVTLLQRKHDNFDYDYIAVRR
tara:strand:- start:261 stop:581 length:321 start_codon:yes stop_codon:yes gene_type:complete